MSEIEHCPCCDLYEGEDEPEQDHVPLPLGTPIFEAIEVPVVDGVATLPNGRRVETQAKYVAIPVVVGFEGQ